MYLLLSGRLRLIFLIGLLSSISCSFSVVSASISYGDKEKITRSCRDMKVPPVWDGDHLTFVHQPFAGIKLDAIIFFAGLLFLLYSVYEYLTTLYTSFIELNKQGIILKNKQMIPWKELELVTKQNIKERGISMIEECERRRYSNKEPEKEYFLVLRRKYSTYDIEVYKNNYKGFSDREVRAFFRVVKAYQAAYGEKGDGKLNKREVEGDFDMVTTTTLKVRCYDLFSETVGLILAGILSGVFIFIFGYDYSKYLYPRWHKLCSVDMEKGITDHRTGTTYSWGQITEPVAELYDRVRIVNNIEMSREGLFKYGFGLEGNDICTFEREDIPNRDIFYNVITIYNGRTPSPDWSKSQAELEENITSNPFRYSTSGYRW